ncbi:MAG: quinolinate synthase NadA [Phycisphaerales bacterium]|jgi:quinolinate synthase|nr:quinolinate synthase NadA [Phycisphaerales bacterium]
MSNLTQLTGITLQPDIPICQSDLPLDWYQEEFKPYAEEYIALPDRTPECVVPWLDSYIKPALDHFGDSLLLLAHYYMGGEIVKMVERYGGKVADSYALALQASRNPEKKVIVESAVHFMAETIATLANDDQQVWITNPKAGCTMEMMAKDWMIKPIEEQLIEKFGDDLLVVAYMNTSGRIKALAGRTGGAVCTSSNAHLVVDWARKQNKKILFVPDEHLGRNTAAKLGMDLSKLVAFPNPLFEGIEWKLDNLLGVDDAVMFLWGGFCGVHTVFTPEQVTWCKEKGWRVLIHPESPLEAVQVADGSGSTAYLWNTVMDSSSGSKFAVGTEGHFVRNLKEQAAQKGIEVMHLAEVDNEHAISGSGSSGGCGCATMSRNDPPHLAGMLDLLRKNEAPDLNCVLAGDTVDEGTAKRECLSGEERTVMVADAKLALERMIEITECAS